MNLEELGEFGFIEKMRTWVPLTRSGVGIGDDAAVTQIRHGSSVVAASDVLVEDVHFRHDWSSPSDVGFKAVSVNVSDLAAMGAEPRWLLLSLCAPPTTAVELLEGVYAGVVEACELYGSELVGGDTVRGKQLVLAVTALGEVEGDPLLRSGAKAGDTIAVTGPLGRAATGVRLLLEDAGHATAEERACIDAHRRPVARVQEGTDLRNAGAHAAIDISDGLASDARRLAEASGVAIELDANRLPVAYEARSVARERGWDEDAIVLGGGEDLELLVALPERRRTNDLIEIGRVVDGEGVWLIDGDRRSDASGVGYDHFR